jgi:HEAT repeat protein
MSPIRALSSGTVVRRAVPAVFLLTAIVCARVGAAPLPVEGVEDFQRLLKQASALSTEDVIPIDLLVERRKAMQDAARRLPSLGEVSRVLLLPEWGATDFGESEMPVPLDKVEAAVRQPDDAGFKREVEKLVKMAKDNAGEVTRMVLVEIKRMVRLTLLERLDQRIRFYLRSQQSSERIAASNLISETMSLARKQDNAELPREVRKAATLGSLFLRQRLHELTGDLQQLTLDAEAPVQVAAVRALSDLEVNPVLSMAVLRPLLNPGRYSVTTRRATGEAFAHIVDIMYLQMDKSRPQAILATLRGLGQIFPAAASGLADADVEVRRACLNACQKVETTLYELVSDRSPVVGMAAYRPMVAVVEKALPDLNRAAQDTVPELRVAACHLLETLVLTAQKVRRLEDSSLPPPLPEPGQPPRKKPSTDVPLPSIHGVQRPHAVRSSQWAAARPPQSSQPILLAPVPFRKGTLAPAVTLDRPVKLAPAPLSRPNAAVRPVAFVAPNIEELPQPAPLEMSLKGTVRAMIEGLSDSDYHVRLASLDVLETFGDRAAPAIPALVKTLADSNKYVRWAAARTLGRLVDRARESKEASTVVRGLTRLLNDREDLSVRITAAYALELYGPSAKEAVPHLARVINRGDKEYIIAILHTLQGIGTDARPALPNVAWILRNRTLPSSVRIEAAQTLGRFGPLASGQIGDLREVMVNETDETVRHAAGDAVLAVQRHKH